MQIWNGIYGVDVLNIPISRNVFIVNENLDVEERWTKDELLSRTKIF